MPKSISGSLASHLLQETTSLATLWRVIRTDTREFFFTDHDVDITFEGNVYVAAIGYNRTAVANQVGLSVDNLDVSGFLDSSALTDGELRAGLYDFAEIFVSIVNFEDLSQGALQMRRGRWGEVNYTDLGTFETELRGMTQAFSQRIVEQYESECRADLGDERCKVPIFPDILLRNTIYEVGDVVRSSALLDGIPDVTLLVSGDVDGGDASLNAAVATFGGEANQQTVVKTIGAGALEFTPTSVINPSDSFVSFPVIAAYDIGVEEFTIEAHIRLKNLSGAGSVDPTFHVVASRYLNTGEERGWALFAETITNELRFFVSDDGTSTAPAVTLTGSFTWVADTWYHVAVTRDSSNDVRMFVDGVQVGSTTQITFSIHDSTAELMLGKWRSVGFSDRPLDGFIDDFRFVVGYAAYTSGFTKPAVAHQAGPLVQNSSLVTINFDDRLYTCTVEGTSAPAQPVYDTGLGNDTIDGTATFVASESWTKAGTVATVIDNRIFTMTFPFGADSRDVIDWFKYGVVGWGTGNNAFTVGLNMEVKNSAPAFSLTSLLLDVDDASTISRSIGSFIDDGIKVGHVITTTGFTDGANNGTFNVAAVNALTLVVVETSLVSESGTGDEGISGGEIITLFLTMPFLIVAGDTFSIYAGCDKSVNHCGVAKFSNIVNMRAEPYLPGQDAFKAIGRSR